MADKLYNERLKKIDAEKKSLLEDYGNTSNKLILRLIDKASFMHVLLQELQDTISKNGVKEKYTNGANQEGFKDSVEVKTYNTMVKNYTTVIKQLNEIEPANKSKTRLEEFKDF